MKKLFVALYLIAIITLPFAAHAEKQFRVIVFGDDLTYGDPQQTDSFAAKLLRKIRSSGYENIQLISLSKGGETAATALTRIHEVEKLFPDVIIIQLGSNDIRRGVPPSITLNNLAQIIETLKPLGAYIILAGARAPESAGEAYRYQVDNSYYLLATQTKVPLYPDILEGVENNSQLTQADGKQPNSAGLDVIVAGIYPHVDAGLRWRFDVYKFDVEQRKNAIPQAILPELNRP